MSDVADGLAKDIFEPELIVREENQKTLFPACAVLAKLTAAELLTVRAVARLVRMVPPFHTGPESVTVCPLRSNVLPAAMRKREARVFVPTMPRVLLFARTNTPVLSPAKVEAFKLTELIGNTIAPCLMVRVTDPTNVWAPMKETAPLVRKDDALLKLTLAYRPWLLKESSLGVEPATYATLPAPPFSPVGAEGFIIRKTKKYLKRQY